MMDVQTQAGMEVVEIDPPSFSFQDVSIVQDKLSKRGYNRGSRFTRALADGTLTVVFRVERLSHVKSALKQ